MLDRDFFRVTFTKGRPDEAKHTKWREGTKKYLLKSGLSDQDSVELDMDYYLAITESGHEAYERAENSIRVIQRDGAVVELSEATQMSAISGIASPEHRPYVCYPKEVL